jgi:hypothetical protein
MLSLTSRQLVRRTRFVVPSATRTCLQPPVGSTTTATPPSFFHYSSSSSSTTTADDEKSPVLLEERPRRCLLSVPGSDARKIEKAKTIVTDAVVLDLEDGVTFDQKDKARELVRETLMNSSFGTSEVCVRINGLSSTGDMARLDLEAILPCPSLRAIVIPKVECSYAIQYVSDQIEALAGANSQDIRIIAAIESASGMVNIKDIAAAANHRLDALVFASEDYW